MRAELIAAAASEHIRSTDSQASATGKVLRTSLGLIFEFDVVERYPPSKLALTGCLARASVSGFRDQRTMRLDFAGWGHDDASAARDAGHGFAEYFYPTLANVAIPGYSGRPFAETTTATGDLPPISWRAWVGRPWPVAILAGDSDATAAAIAEAARDVIVAAEPPTFVRVLPAFLQKIHLDQRREARAHWALLTWTTSAPTAALGALRDVRVAVDNSYDPRASAALSIDLPSNKALIVVRQLMVMCPQLERTQPAPGPNVAGPRRRWWPLGRAHRQS